MMQRSMLRVLFGFAIGGFAGISMATGILPFVIGQLTELTSFEVLIFVRTFTLSVALLWAIGGGMIGWYGGLQMGTIILGVCGILGGLILGAFAMSGDAFVIAVSILTGLIYGGLGGALFGRIFPESLPEEA